MKWERDESELDESGREGSDRNAPARLAAGASLVDQTRVMAPLKPFGKNPPAFAPALRFA